MAGRRCGQTNRTRGRQDPAAIRLQQVLMRRIARRVAVLIGAALLISACSPGEEPAASTVPEPSTSLVSTTSPVVLTTTSTSTTAAPTTTTAAAPTTTVQLEALRIPHAAEPLIDGVLSDGEWDDATVDLMSDGATVHFMHSAGTLYIAVAGREVGAVNVLLATTDEVWILHSSAALGSALYVADAGGWDLSHGYDWCCRDSSDESQRLELFEDEGWQANIGFTGDPGVVEYAVELPWTEAAVAISSIRDDTDTGFWPIELSEEARSQLLGVPPQQRMFVLGEWRHILPAEE